LTVRLNKITNNLNPRLKRTYKAINNLPQEAFKHFRSITPIRTGNARRKTKLRGDSIIADYPYAGRLDRGYSRQAPEGMSEPTKKFIRQRLRNITGR
jgi:hypothetical protein